MFARPLSTAVCRSRFKKNGATYNPEKIMKTNKYLITALFLLSISFLYPANWRVVSVRTNPNSIYLKIQVDLPQLVMQDGRAFAAYEQAAYLVDQNQAYVPYFSKLFNLAGTKISAPRILSLKTQNIAVENYLRILNPNSGTHRTQDKVEAKYVGQFKKAPLFSLRIFPVQYNPDSRQLACLREMEIEIRNEGTVTKEGASPVRADFLKRLMLNETAVYRQSVVAAKTESSAPSYPPNPALYMRYRFKIGVAEQGIYKISFHDLEDNDFPLQRIDPRHLKLFNKGREIPVYFYGEEDGCFDDSDYFEFWGEANEKTFFDQYPDVYKDPFSDINIYWLVYDDSEKRGLRLPRENAGLSNVKGSYVFTPYAFTETLHFEQDKHHEKFGHSSAMANHPSYQLDNWYFDLGISAPEGVAYDFTIPDPFESGANVVIKAMFRGKSFYDRYDNPILGHQVQLKLRGKGDKSKLIGQVRPQDGWKDQHMRLISNADSLTKLSQSSLVNGVNRLEVDMFQTGVTDMVLLNWFEVTYLRKYRAYKDFLKFKVDEEFFNNTYINLGDTIQINIDGFTSDDISVYKLGVSRMVNGTIGTVLDNRTSSIGVSIQDQVFDPAVEYVACTEKAKKKPLFISEYKNWKADNPARTIVDQSNSFDYLIITSEFLYQNALKLAALKNQQGFAAEAVKVEDIYDWFNYGIKSPLAIKNFLRFALEKWNSTNELKYVLFVGKGSFNNKNYKNKNADPVPTFMYQTVKFGSASADYWYSLLEGDDYIPEIIVGRVPAETNQELLHYIDKVDSYYKADDKSGWRNRALFISGKDVGSGDLEDITNKPIFRAQNLRLINQQLPARTFARRLNTVQDENVPNDPNFGGATDLIEYFDEGLSFINFLGHGGGGVWADASVLDLPGVDRLNNGDKLPFVSSMTCFTGAFENPGVKSLGEKLIVAEDKGAIAIVSSSGVGWKYNDFAVEWSLFDYLWDKNLSMGEAVNLMKINYLANSIYYTDAGETGTRGYSTLYRSMVCQYNFLGDPSLKIQQAQDELNVTASSYTLQAGDTVRIRISGGVSGEGYIEITNADNDFVLQQNMVYESSGTEIDFPVLQDSVSQKYRVKAYASDGETDAAGYTELTVKQPLVRHIKIIPQNPQVNQELNFELTVPRASGINSMSLLHFRDYNRTVSGSYPGMVQMGKVSDTLFHSLASFSGFSTGGLKYFDISVQDEAGNAVLYKRQKIHITDPRPDVFIDPSTLRYTGNDQLLLEFDLVNNSDLNLNNVTVSCYDSSGIANSLPFASLAVSLNSAQQKTLTVAYNSLRFAASRQFMLKVDPDNEIPERNEFNNTLYKELQTDHMYVERNIGTTLDGATNQPVALNERWQFFVQKNQLNSSQVIGFNEIAIAGRIKSGAQSGLRYVPFGSRPDTTALQVSFSAAGKAQLAVIIDSLAVPQADLDYIGFYKFDDFLNLWVKESSDREGRRISAEIDKSGLYSVFYLKDVKEPAIEVSANGLPLVSDMLVVRKPSLGILLQDENGVNYSQTLTVTVDDNALVTDGTPSQLQEVSIPDSVKNASVVSITTSPTLAPGRHKLTVKVADINGNLSSKEFDFIVTGGFDIKVFGNYPNPFSDQTIISFYVDSDNEIDDLNIRIYTISGRLIRKKLLDLDDSVADNNIKMPFYHELIWDGTDEDGRQVANGVYFMVVKGKYKGKTVTHTLKIARLR